MDIEILVLSSGGVNGLQQLGALNYFHQKNMLSNIDKYCGTSIGAVISLLLIVGYTPMEIFEHSLKFNLSKKNNLVFTEIIKNWGLVNHKVISEFVAKLVFKKLKFIPTMRELFILTNKTLITCCYNVTDMKTEYMTWENYPELSCIDAVTASCCLPFIFYKFQLNNKIYSDGAKVQYCPLNYVNDETSKILCITFNEKPSGDITFGNYIYRLFVNCDSSETFNITPNVYLINLEDGTHDTLSFDIPQEEKLAMFMGGYKKMIEREKGKTQLLFDHSLGNNDLHSTTTRHRHIIKPKIE